MFEALIFVREGGDFMVINEAVVKEEVIFNDATESCHGDCRECGHECRER